MSPFSTQKHWPHIRFLVPWLIFTILHSARGLDMPGWWKLTTLAPNRLFCEMNKYTIFATTLCINCALHNFYSNTVCWWDLLLWFSFAPMRLRVSRTSTTWTWRTSLRGRGRSWWCTNSGREGIDLHFTVHITLWELLSMLGFLNTYYLNGILSDNMTISP